MSSLLSVLAENLGGENLSQLSQQIGSDEATTKTALGAALPALLGGLSRNAAQPGGAEQLHKAIERDHDGSVMDNVGAFLGQGGDAGAGEGILGHVFGDKTARVEQGVSQLSGLDSSSTTKLMATLAPIVMGALGKQQKSEGLDASALAGFLGQEREAVEKAKPEQAGILGQLLDQDGDGDFDIGDMAKLGMSALGRMLSDKK